jgi:hypothetical protein
MLAAFSLPQAGGAGSKTTIFSGADRRGNHFGVAEVGRFQIFAR